VSEGKPSPQIFLRAAGKLGIAPEDCVVIEDAVAGVQAAKGAGMRCVAVTNTHPAARLKAADRVVNSLQEINIQALTALFCNKKGETTQMERTLILVKPDAMERNLGGAILARLEAAGLKIVALRILHIDNALANRHYAVHIGKPFFNDLIAYITSYPVIAAIFEGQDAVAVARRTMGATDPRKAEAGTIRKDFGLDLQRNSVHGSDSPENAVLEMSLYFKKEEIVTR
jgi:nucleoside-diphosphate kinase